MNMVELIHAKICQVLAQPTLSCNLNLLLNIRWPLHRHLHRSLPVYEKILWKSLREKPLSDPREHAASGSIAMDKALINRLQDPSPLFTT